MCSGLAHADCGALQLECLRPCNKSSAAPHGEDRPHQRIGDENAFLPEGK